MWQPHISTATPLFRCGTPQVTQFLEGPTPPSPTTLFKKGGGGSNYDLLSVFDHFVGLMLKGLID